MKFEDTVIETSGVFRCCIATLDVALKGQNVKLQQESKCMFCNRKFVLVKRTAARPAWISPESWAKPIWRPVDSLK